MESGALSLFSPVHGAGVRTWGWDGSLLASIPKKKKSLLFGKWAKMLFIWSYWRLWSLVVCGKDLAAVGAIKLRSQRSVCTDRGGGRWT